MQRKVKRWFAIFLAVLLLLLQTTAAVEGQAALHDTFDVAQMNPNISISEALEIYPEITETFYIRALSTEEALQKIAQGVQLTVLDDVSAQDLLLALSARSSNCFSNW